MASTHPRIAFAGLALSIGSFSILQSLLIPVLPVMQRDLGTDTAGITWTVTIWLLTAAVATPLIGRVGDMIGRRRMFLITLVGIAIGSILAAFAPNLTVLLIARVIQGAGGATFPLAFGLARDTFTPNRVASMVGALSAILAIGSGLGTVLAGPLSDWLTWRGLFAVPLLLTIVGGILSATALPESATRATGGINPISAVLLSAWLVALLLALSYGSSWGWGSAAITLLLVAAVVLIVAWVWFEASTKNPLVDMHIMRAPATWPMNASSLLIGASTFAVTTYFARFVQVPSSTGYGLGLTVSESGALMLPLLIVMAVAGFASGPLIPRMPPRAQVVFGGTVIALASVAIAVFHSAAWQLAIAGAVFGVGFGFAFAAMTTVIVQRVPADQIGVATGMNTNLRTIGGAIGVAVMTAIVTGSTTSTGTPTEGGYRVGFIAVAAFAAAAVILTLVTGRIRAPRPDHLAPLAATTSS